MAEVDEVIVVDNDEDALDVGTSKKLSDVVARLHLDDEYNLGHEADDEVPYGLSL